MTPSAARVSIMEKTRYDLTDADYKLIVSALRYMRLGMKKDIDIVLADRPLETAFTSSARVLIADVSNLLSAIE
jgi:hypothetical protein